MAKSYDVTAIPFEGFESFNRVGKKWGRTPRTVTVRTLREGEKLGPDEITEADLEILLNEARIKAYPSDSDEAANARRRAELLATSDETSPVQVANTDPKSPRTSRGPAGTAAAAAGGTGGTGPTG